MVRALTLLAAALGDGDAHELFGWLRRLSFVEEGRHGLFPHDLARKVLDADLRWRNPEGYLELHRRVRRFIVGHLRQARGRERQQAFFDLLYLHRHNPSCGRRSTGRRSAPRTWSRPPLTTGRPCWAWSGATRARTRPGSPSTGGGGSPKPSPPSRPAATQELAPERLGLPFSTYCYQLAGGVRRVTEWLWQRELHGDE